MYRYVVERNEPLTSSTLLLTLRHADEERKIISYHSGQYAAISFLHKKRLSHARCFSIASSPTDGDALQFGIRVGGRFTRALQKATPGDTVFVRGPFGGFVIDETRHRDVILIAGGIGITPFMSMLRTLRATQYPHAVHLLYGVQSQDDIAFIDELRAMVASWPQLHMVLGVSHGDIDKVADMHAAQGRIDASMLHEALEGRPAEKTVFICGPPSFMQSMVESAKIRGVPNAQIITEAFKQGSHRQTGKVVSWPRNMYVLGGLGMAVGAFAILINDIISNLPKTPFSAGAANQQLHASSKRATDLDALVNSFPAEVASQKSNSPGAALAMGSGTDEQSAAANAPTTSTTQNAPVSQAPAPSSTTSNTTAPPATASPPPSQPATPPQPVCTTSQSGVTTCV